MRRDVMFGPSLRALLDQSAAPVLEFLQNQRQQMVNTNLRRVLEYLEGNLFVGFSRADLLRDLDLRHHQVANAFRETLGEPLMHFVRHRRLEAAAHLLTFPEPLVSEVSELTGFKSNRSFPTAFRNWSGLTPSQFRKKAEALRQGISDDLLENDDLSKVLGDDISFEASRTLIAWMARECPALRVHLPSSQTIGREHKGQDATAQTCVAVRPARCRGDSRAATGAQDLGKKSSLSPPPISICTSKFFVAIRLS